MTIQIGDTASRTKVITADDIQAFATLSTDTNPVHLDEAYAAQSPFGKRVAHGMLTASLISAVLGNDLPGHGTIYLSQSIQFKAPVFVGDEITATVECVQYRESRRLATFKTTCHNAEGKLVVDGEAVVIAPEPS